MAGPTPSGRKRPNSKRRDARRERILDAAAMLFREKGFGAANIDEIGTAAGVSGPAVYYYFATKSDLLAAVFFRLGDQMINARDAALEGVTDPHQTLDTLVDTYVRSVLANRELIPLLYQEDRHLLQPQYNESRLRRRMWYEFWAHTLQCVRTELSDADARAISAGAMWLIHSIAFYQSGAPDDGVHRLLKSMAFAALMAEPGGASESTPKPLHRG